MNLWLVFFIAACLLCWGIAELVGWIDQSRPKQIDWVAQRKRAIDRRAFKSRIGAR